MADEPMAADEARHVPHNTPAGWARLFGLLSLVPGLALVAGPLAVACGIVGLRADRRRPTWHGRRNAWLGIGLGGLLFIVVAAFAAKVWVMSVHDHAAMQRRAETMRKSRAPR